MVVSYRFLSVSLLVNSVVPYLVYYVVLYLVYSFVSFLVYSANIHIVKILYTAYCIYNDMERVLFQEKSTLSDQ